MSPERIPIGGIFEAEDMAAIQVMGIIDRPGVAARLFSALAQSGVNVEFISQTTDDSGYAHMTFCIKENKTQEALTALDLDNRSHTFKEVRAVRNVALISIFGPHFRERPGIAGAFFHALARAGINIRAISTSVSTCTCVIAQDDLPRARQALKEAFVVLG